MTLIEFYDKAKAITTAHGFGDNSLAVSATINDYAATKELAFQYQCAVFVPNCVVTGTHDSPEKALAKLELICKEANIAKMEGGSTVESIDAPIVDNAAPVGHIEGLPVYQVVGGDVSAITVVENADVPFVAITEESEASTAAIAE